ncbi:hypothetical protein E4665_16760 [Sporolactobacillus shoreae]|uniref:Uncharacterized protein n=1 Tax=Sporolactobacillus shoreae TaxID=1465501 RepID=A0A4Z0GHB6_9BACL|nr:hypothetical protein [Sporolactobacillus shoreae]TGA96078.1 hypothetical protein E4665_16760 [Sporolactobacillus shoreae]
MKFYNSSFSTNEWFILIVGIAAYTLLFLLPKRLTRSQTVLTLIMGIYFVALFDQTLCKVPFNYYDVNDTSYFELWDALSYIMYGPFAYFFIYGYSIIKKFRSTFFFYILTWAVFSMFAEALAWHAGVYHYRNGYQMFFSIPVYLLVLSLTMLYYQCYIRQHK